jgi:uncharacterized membrane protein
MVNPSIWGKHGWQFLHYVSIGYPENPTPEQKKQYQDFYLNIGNVLPCSKCQKNYYRHLEENPLTDTILSNKENFKNWVIAMHNAVNLENGKNIIGFSEADIHIKNDTCQEDLKQINQMEREIVVPPNANPSVEILNQIEKFTDVNAPSKLINQEKNDTMYLMGILFIALVIFILFRK